MAMKIGLIVFLLFLLKDLCCQEKKDPFYENIFKKEIQNSNEKFDLSHFTPPEILPDWFLNVPQREPGVIYAIGISDPWMDAEKGKIQAINRAFCIAYLMKKTQTKGITELFNNNQDNKYKQISQFSVAQQKGLLGEPSDSFKTKFQEQLFLMRFTEDTATKDPKSFIEYFIVSDNHEVKYNQIEKLKMISDLDNVKAEYESIEINEETEVLSIMKSDTIKIKPFFYRYTTNNNTSKSDSIQIAYFLKKGLWQFYLKSLINNLDVAASNMSFKLKSMSDKYEDGQVKDNLKNLTKTIYELSFSFSITSINLKEKVLEIGLNLSDVTKK